MMLASGTDTLIQQVYTDLDLVGENLLDVPVDPYDPSRDDKWAALGDWLLLAHRINADKVFFVNDDPVLVFSTLPSDAAEKDILDCYRRTWSLARPRCLFLEIRDELRVYSLENPPQKSDGHEKPVTPLAVVKQAAEVLEKLAHLRRDRIESGVAFEKAPEFKRQRRADKQLLRDVRSATAALDGAGLARPIAHSLIERVILVRYLEDRGIITDAYFDAVTSKIRVPSDLQTEADHQPNFGQPSRFISFLANKTITYALFDQLAEDFNGDLFVTNTYERDIVTNEHLQLLKRLLQGTDSDVQEPLFFWAYDFSVIPTNLISTMYEIFHQEEVRGGQSSTHYTSPELVEFVLDSVFEPNLLEKSPVVCDPACGSGVFLVEAYRRIVRHEMVRKDGRLSNNELKELLLNRIVGCDIDDAAIRLAAFSLYVAFLNYQTPQDILNAGPLPPLISRNGLNSDPAPLIVGDAFSTALDCKGHGAVENPKLAHEPSTWRSRGFDVVVGNPPWTQLRGPIIQAERWASERKFTIGDRSPSQLFLWRATDLLATDGVAALLIHAKTIFNKRSTSIQFRKQWLQSVVIEHVVNFNQVRKDFFASAIAPFMMLKFREGDGGPNAMVVYESALPVPRARQGSVALARLDRQVVPQRSLLFRDYLWKAYSVGSLRDEALLSRLELEDRLGDLTREGLCAFGYQRGRNEQEGRPPSSFLRNLPSLRKLPLWGPIDNSVLEEVPNLVKWAPDERLFNGLRLLVGLGVAPGFGPVSRLISTPLAFRHSIYAISMDHLSDWQSDVILGTLLSSLGRYWLYMNSGSWGVWRDQVGKTELLNLPIHLTNRSDKSTHTIRRVIEEMSSLPSSSEARQRQAVTIQPQIDQIDEGIADLFHLSDPERHLVEDFWARQRQDSIDKMPHITTWQGTSIDLDSRSCDGIIPYLKIFLNAWSSILGEMAYFRWRILRPSGLDIVAAVFEIHAHGDQYTEPIRDMEHEEWTSALERIQVAWDTERTRSILRYGMVRVVTDTAIVIVKRDEKRLWTPSAAWQDADATTAQLMSVKK